MSAPQYNEHLLEACRMQDADWARMALGFGADVDSRDGSGNSPLHVVLLHPGEKAGEMIGLLMDAGANLNGHNSDGLTALALAEKLGRWDLALMMAGHRLKNEDAA